MGFLPALCLILVAAKLTGFIMWSWWLVFAPVIIPGCIAILLFAIIGLAKL